jgi:hypothetical protein
MDKQRSVQASDRPCLRYSRGEYLFCDPRHNDIPELCSMQNSLFFVSDINAYNANNDLPASAVVGSNFFIPLIAPTNPRF